MKRDEVVRGVTGYFRSDHWRRLVAALQDPDPHNTHIHSYVDTCVHPNSLEEVICGYFEIKGWPSSRRIDHMSPRPGLGSLHGIEPLGKPHFDFQWSFKLEVVLAGSEGGEAGANLLVWNRWYMEEFYKDIDFRPVTRTEYAALREYFKSAHWQHWLDEIVLDRTTGHTHINVYTSIHPNTIKRFAEEALAAKGWEVFYTCPNVYLVSGQYTGKLVFMGKKPEAVYDLGWRFNPDVLIEPARDVWVWPDSPGCDVWTTPMLEAVMDHLYVKLEPGEVRCILTALTRMR